MRKNNLRYVCTALCITFFLILAAGSLDSDNSSSDENPKKSKKDNTEKIESNPALKEEPEQIFIYNSTEEENASDGEEDVIIINNSTEEENASDDEAEYIIMENSSEDK